MGASIFFTYAMIRKGTDHCSSEVWQELEYRIDVCGLTRGARIEHLYLSKKTFFSFRVAVNNSTKVGPLVFLL
jgi:hypothetical protein